MDLKRIFNYKWNSWFTALGKDNQVGDKLRYHCHIGKPVPGHIFIAHDRALYNQPQGTTYCWKSRKLWHAGSNVGLEPKYLLNLW